MLSMPDSRPTLLITGGAKRIGRALCLQFAQGGWNIALHYHRSQDPAEATAREVRALGALCEIIACDLRDKESVAALVPAVTERMGPLAGFIHNASHFEKDSAASATHRDAHFAVNFHAPLALTERLAAQWPHGTGGHALYLLDGCFGWSMGPNFHSYTESRRALWREIPTLALRYAPGLRVNGLALGHTLAGEFDKPRTAEKMRLSTPLQRLSDVQEVCDAARFLFAAPSVTGQILQLNGGLGLIHSPG